MQLRPYQQRAVESLRELFHSGHSRLLLVAPTGSGKTVIAAHLVRSAVSLGNGAAGVLFLAHRKELIDQASSKLTISGIEHGIIMAGHPFTRNPVQVASIQTLARRVGPRQTPEMEAFLLGVKLIIVDEAHHASAASYQEIISLFPEATVIGLTATPFRSNGQGLGSAFQAVTRVAGISELTQLGYLVNARYWAPSAVDMTGVKTVRGDYSEADNMARVDKPKIIGDITATYQRVASGKRAICFAVNVDHSTRLAGAFNMAGIPAAHLDANTSKEERTRILADLVAGHLLVVCNCGILSEGYDNPAVEVCIQARPTASLSLYLQQIGRVLRPHPGKGEALILDHAGNLARHGFASDVYDVDLSEGLSAPSKRAPAGLALQTCAKCYAVLPKSATECPCCWEKLEGKTMIKPPPEKKGSLEEVRPDLIQKFRSEGLEQRVSFLRGVQKVALEKGYKPGWAAFRFKVKYGRWPRKEEYAA
jgi:superfamily II DNA or RNA helicase